MTFILRLRRPAALSMLLVAGVLAGCAGLNEPVALTPVITSSAPLSLSERTFLSSVAAKNMYQLEVSRLAAKRAIDPRVRAYAESMVVQHEQANADLIAFMSAKGVAPPKTLTVRSANKLHRLAALPPSADFDKGYVRVIGVEEHSTHIANFERVRRETHDRDLRAWIDRQLPALRRQLNVAQNLAGTIAA